MNNKPNRLAFTELFQEYVSMYLKEFGEKKAKEIADKVNSSNKCNKLMSEAARLKTKPGTDDFVATVMSSISFSFAKPETICLASLLLFYRWQHEIGSRFNLADESYLKMIFYRIIDKCEKLKIHTSSEKSFFERFYIHLNGGQNSGLINSYSETAIQNEILLNQRFILDDIEKIEDFFEISNEKKFLVIEYLKYISFIVAGAILMYKLNKSGYTHEDEECKKVFRAVYHNSATFLKTFINTNKIKFPEFEELKEEYLILTIKVKLEGYTEDIKEFIETGNPSFVEEIESDEEGYGNYINEIQYRFIQDIYETEFQETSIGISLKFHYKDYLDYNNLDENIKNTLAKINTLSNR